MREKLQHILALGIWCVLILFFVVTTILIVAILYNREFHSDVLGVFDDGN